MFSCLRFATEKLYGEEEASLVRFVRFLNAPTRPDGQAPHRKFLKKSSKNALAQLPQSNSPHSKVIINCLSGIQFSLVPVAFSVWNYLIRTQFHGFFVIRTRFLNYKVKWYESAGPFYDGSGSWQGGKVTCCIIPPLKSDTCT
jgi:hypothetical protein